MDDPKLWAEAWDAAKNYGDEIKACIEERVSFREILANAFVAWHQKGRHDIAERAYREGWAESSEHGGTYQAADETHAWMNSDTRREVEETT